MCYSALACREVGIGRREYAVQSICLTEEGQVMQMSPYEIVMIVFGGITLVILLIDKISKK